MLEMAQTTTYSPDGLWAYLHRGTLTFVYCRNPEGNWDRARRGAALEIPETVADPVVWDDASECWWRVNDPPSPAP